KKILADAKTYFWDDPFLYKHGKDLIIRRCVPLEETDEIIQKCHDSDYGGHFGSCLLYTSILKKHKKAFGWTIADIKGISPSICMHRILMEENCNPRADPQRRLNPIMKEVVKKEILKWLDAGIIYPISDSAWVSPIHCVPKKGGVTVTVN
ncbi:hypothetical protein, partial [Enterococcus sp. HPCN18]|uniref:hypothetical protein n=1 Tax=Enterococcus sp. HPCN18 TaxID=2248751 RepID=UPI000DCC08D3